MMRYVYHCERCGTTFELEGPDDIEAPREYVCPRCEYPHALRAFALRPTGGCCPPTESG